MIKIPAHVIAKMPDKSIKLFIDKRVATQCGGHIIVTNSTIGTIFESKGELLATLKLETRKNVIKTFVKNVYHSKDRQRVERVLSYTPEEFSIYLAEKGIEVDRLKNLMVTKGYITFFDFLERVNVQKLASMLGSGGTYIDTIQQVLEEEKIPWELIFKKRKPPKMRNEKIKTFLKKPVAELLQLGLGHMIYNRLKFSGCTNLKDYIKKIQMHGKEMQNFGKTNQLELENFLEHMGIPRDVDLNKYV
jgi:hypothetical protein